MHAYVQERGETRERASGDRQCGVLAGTRVFSTPRQRLSTAAARNQPPPPSSHHTIPPNPQVLHDDVEYRTPLARRRDGRLAWDTGVTL